MMATSYRVWYLSRCMPKDTAGNAAVSLSGPHEEEARRALLVLFATALEKSPGLRMQPLSERAKRNAQATRARRRAPSFPRRVRHRPDRARTSWSGPGA